VRLFFAGMLMTGYVTVALFFLRFWSRTKDQLFGAFAVAFVLLAVQRVLLANHTDGEAPVWIYVVRLLAFVIILLAIAQKNVMPARRWK
jgi:protein-S-isoprenylcysteine O-methyltransferase Ste14